MDSLMSSAVGIVLLTSSDIIAITSGETGWGRLSRLLYTLGDKDYWKDPLGDWLIDEVIPALEWGLGAKLAEAGAGHRRNASRTDRRGRDEGEGRAPGSRQGRAGECGEDGKAEGAAPKDAKEVA